MGRKLHSGRIVSKCYDYAYNVAKQKGLSYQKATKMFPMGYNRKSVYIDKVNIHEAHCVHCARAEVLIKIYKSD